MAVTGLAWSCNRLLPILTLIASLLCTTFADLVSYVQVLEPRQLYTYEGYQDVQMFHYVVPAQAMYSTWSFKAFEQGGCSPKQISIYLQHGSYPLINPNNASYPPHFYLNRTSLQEVNLCSDSTAYTLNVSTPEPGDWFAGGFLPDRNDHIEQKGLYPDCKTLISSTVKSTIEHAVTHLLPGVSMPQRTETSQHYKFYNPENTWTSKVLLKNCATVPSTSPGEVECPVVIYARPSVLHSPGGVAEYWINCTENYEKGQCVLEFIPRENSWHYLWLDIGDAPRVEYQITVETSACENGYSPTQYLILSEFKLSNSSMAGTKDSLLNVTNSAKRVLMPLPVSGRMRSSASACWPRIPLLRKTFPGNFVFTYQQHPNENGTTALKMDISNLVPTLLIVPIQSVIDIGGTLTYELLLDRNLNTTVYNVSVLACIEKNKRSLIYGMNNCSSPLSLTVNTSSVSSMSQYVMIPFPEPGNWYVTMAAYCYVENSSASLYPEWPRSVETVSCSTNTTSVILNAVSASCVFGGCGSYGQCYQYISGGLIFSTCVCTAGWRGYACNDGTYAIPNFELLLSTLLLTLSNLLFIPAIILAVYRQFYTEALVYFLTMFFSTFYHACDEDAYAFCLMKLNVLQFCDFYTAILSVWVTLVAMADLPPQLYSVLHMAGAICVALGVEYDRTGLLVFAVPSVAGVLILALSWVWHCQQQKACFPEKKIWIMCLLPGVLLAAAGLACYAFFETEENYKYVHSAWHMAMALCILFLLPPTRKHQKVAWIEDEPVELSVIKGSTEGVLDVHWKPQGSFKFLQENETEML